ncbi:hypothetical protein ACFZCU_41840 [Streptomyces canus]|uniref:hypothetical protein n=1 Tax=Streptomyces canus TaxID=58343 RepID=UPI0036E14607
MSVRRTSQATRAAGRTPAGGPLDGLLLDITGWRPEEIDDGVALRAEAGQFGPGGRALYDPRPGDPSRWDWGGDSP